MWKYGAKTGPAKTGPAGSLATVVHVYYGIYTSCGDGTEVKALIFLCYLSAVIEWLPTLVTAVHT